jgi:hypothetical protein
MPTPASAVRRTASRLGRPVWTPPSLLVLTIMLAAPAVSAGAADTGPVADSGVAIVPADAAFLSATLRLREQYDLLVKSNAFQALKQLPAVSRALASLDEQKTMPGSPLSMVFTFLELPENEQAVEVVTDMISSDTFVYGEPSCISFIKLVKKLQQVQQLAGIATPVLEAEDDAEDADDEELSAEQRQLRMVVKTLADNLDLLVVPDLVWGFKTSKLDAGRSQLKRLEVLVKFFVQANPELADSLARRKVAGGDVVTFTLQGEQLPWSEIERQLEENAADVEGLDKVLDRLRDLEFVIALGVIGDRVILSIGDSVDHLEKLALPGSGRKGLISMPGLAPLLEQQGKRITAVSHISQPLAVALAPSRDDADAMLRVAREALEANRLPREAAEETKAWLERTAEAYEKRLPEPGPWTAFSFLTDQGYEGYAWDWSQNQPFDGTKRLDLLEHAGGAPLGVVVSRIRSDATLFRDLVAFVQDAWKLITKYGIPAMGDDDDREKIEGFREHIAPLGATLVDILQQKIMPSLADGQVGLVLDAKARTKRLQKDLPSSTEPLPLIEPAIVLPLGNAKLFREGLSDLFALGDDLVDAMREMDPDSVPEGYRVPEPEKAKVEGGTVWSFALTGSGVDEQVRPSIGVGEEAAVFSLVTTQAGRLLAQTTLETGSQLSKFEEPLAGAAALDCAALVDAIKPWIVYFTRFGCVQQKEGEVDPDLELSAEDENAQAKEALQHVGVVLEAIKSLRVAVAETTITDEAVVTRWRNVIRDMPAK